MTGGAMPQTTETMTGRNTQIALHFLEAVDRQEFDSAEKMLSPNFQLYFSNQQLNREQTMALVRAVYEAFADFTHHAEETIAADDRVVIRMTLRATHTGVFEGLPPSGRRIDVGQISIFRIAGDQIAEIREEADMLALMQQIGAIPSQAS
jgi:steroid delta-isomerase-like uncharacterized protein